jgi:hypothetical protein
MNQWNIPDWLEDKIRKRDKLCVYCRILMKESSSPRDARKKRATWEHINNDEWRQASGTNVVRCCGSCNSSKSTKPLTKWFESDYCKEKNINKKTVMPVVKRWLRRNGA